MLWLEVGSTRLLILTFFTERLFGLMNHQGNHWFKALIIEDELDLATSTLNAVQPKIQRLHQDLRQEATVCVF